MYKSGNQKFFVLRAMPSNAAYEKIHQVTTPMPISGHRQSTLQTRDY